MARRLTIIHVTLTISSTGTISDLNVSLVVTHTWGGDLTFHLQHLDTGTRVTIVDRPGVPATVFACSRDNIVAILDDEALSPVEDGCAFTEPTINGTFIPNNPLSNFQEEDLNGTWALNAIDPLGADIGTLHEWCVMADILPTLTPTPTDTSLPPTTTSTPSLTQLLTPTPSLTILPTQTHTETIAKTLTLSPSPTGTVSPPKHFVFLPGVYK